MDRKELLLHLCKELYETVEHFYHEDSVGLEEIDKRMFPQEKEEQNPEPQTQKETDELPF